MYSCENMRYVEGYPKKAPPYTKKPLGTSYSGTTNVQGVGSTPCCQFRRPIGPHGTNRLVVFQYEVPNVIKTKLVQNVNRMS